MWYQCHPHVCMVHATLFWPSMPKNEDFIRKFECLVVRFPVTYFVVGHVTRTGWQTSFITRSLVYLYMLSTFQLRTCRYISKLCVYFQNVTGEFEILWIECSHLLSLMGTNPNAIWLTTSILLLFFYRVLELILLSQEKNKNGLFSEIEVQFFQTIVRSCYHWWEKS